MAMAQALKKHSDVKCDWRRLICVCGMYVVRAYKFIYLFLKTHLHMMKVEKSVISAHVYGKRCVPCVCIVYV